MPTQSPLRVVEKAEGYWHVTIDNPPINLFDPTIYAHLRLLMDRLEADGNAKVVVFDSANPDYFISHLDVDHAFEVPNIPGAANLATDWPYFIERLANSPVISIVSLRGRTRGIGNEFILACDMRFASREKAILGQPEVGFGVVPGGGGLDWLPDLVGRSRALEIVLGAEDFDAATAAEYGWINRAIPDAELDKFIHLLATRIASFDKKALTTAKRMINSRKPPPPQAGIADSFSAIAQAISWPEAHQRMAIMKSKGWGKPGDVEMRHPYYVGLLGAELKKNNPVTRPATRSGEQSGPENK